MHCELEKKGCKKYESRNMILRIIKFNNININYPMIRTITCATFLIFTKF